MSTPLGWTPRDGYACRVVLTTQEGEIIDRGYLHIESVYRFHDEGEKCVEYGLAWDDPTFGPKLYISGHEKPNPSVDDCGPFLILKDSGNETWHIGREAEAYVERLIHSWTGREAS